MMTSNRIAVFLAASLFAGTVQAQSSLPLRLARPDEVVLADSSESRKVDPLSSLELPIDPRMGKQEAAFAALYVIDTTGHVEMPTVSFTAGGTREFYDVVCASLKKAQFAPIRRNGDARRGLVIETWTFSHEGGQWHDKAYDAAPIRAAVIREGMRAVASSLESQPHCR